MKRIIRNCSESGFWTSNEIGLYVLFLLDRFLTVVFEITIVYNNGYAFTS